MASIFIFKDAELHRPEPPQEAKADSPALQGGEWNQKEASAQGTTGL